MAGPNFGNFTWVILFVTSGILCMYLTRYCVFPRLVRWRHNRFKKRVNAVLNRLDDVDEEKDVQQVDPTTGEIFWLDERGQRDQSTEKAEQAPLSAGEAVDLENGEGKEENNFESRSSKKKKERLSPKKIALLKLQLEERTAHEEACRRALYVPLREERLRIVRDSFEKRIEGGNMGWQLTVEHKNTIGADVLKGLQLRDQRSAMFFHQLALKEKMERGRPKARYFSTAAKEQGSPPVSPGRGQAPTAASFDRSCGAKKLSGSPRPRSPSPDSSPRRQQLGNSVEEEAAVISKRATERAVKELEKEAATKAARAATPSAVAATLVSSSRRTHEEASQSVKLQGRVEKLTRPRTAPPVPSKTTEP